MTAMLVRDRLYTLREACEVLRISESTARRWLKQGRLRGRKIGRDYRILGSDLLRSFDSSPASTEDVVFEPSSPDHPLLKLIGAWDSGHTDIAEEHDRYLAEAYRDKHS